MLKNIEGKELNIYDSSKLIKHANDPRNHVKTIVAQINSGYYDVLKPYIKGNIVDLGSNVGLFSIFVAEVVKKVIAVEPMKEYIRVHQDLCDTLKITNTQYENAAISDTPLEHRKFFIRSDNFTMNSLVDSENTSYIEIEATTLQDIINKYSLDTINFMKIDIEGGEDALLNNESFITLIEDKVKALFIEIHVFNDVKFSSFEKKRDYYINKFSQKFIPTIMGVDAFLLVRRKEV